MEGYMRFTGQMRFSGKLINQSDKAEIKDVSGFVHVDIGAATTWDGMVDLPDGAAVKRGESYRLVMDDERSGEILIQEILSKANKAEVATFLGLGSPP